MKDLPQTSNTKTKTFKLRKFLRLYFFGFLITLFCTGPTVAQEYDWSIIHSAPNRISSVWANSESDLFIGTGGGGIPGIVQRFDGLSWNTELSPGIGDITEIKGGHPNSVYAVGGQPGKIFHFDGSSWSLAYSGGALEHFTSVYEASTNSVWAVSNSSGDGIGRIYHYDGTNWNLSFVSNTVGPGFYDIFGFGDNDIFAVGYPDSFTNAGGATIWHFNGTTWSQQSHQSSASVFNSVWGISGNNVWVAGLNIISAGVLEPVIVHFDGTSWTNQAINSTSVGEIRSIWGIDTSNVYAVGRETNVTGDPAIFLALHGSEWIPEPFPWPDDLRDISISDSGTLYAIGITGSVYKGVPVVPTCNGLTATIEGTDGNDTIIGTTGDDVIVGRDGNDTIAGLDGSDTICGGSGNDTISGGKGNDHLHGGKGNDSISGNRGDDFIRGRKGNDSLEGGNGDDTIRGDDGNDTCSGGNGADTDQECEVIDTTESTIG